VSQRGRAFRRSRIALHAANRTGNYPIVVTGESRHRSAAEIVSGALQDHDRALIRRRDHIARGWYRPSIRCRTTPPRPDHLPLLHPQRRLIQRNYTGVPCMTTSTIPPIDRRATPNREVKLTDSGRAVYGGGGITPDVKIDTPNPTVLRMF